MRYFWVGIFFVGVAVGGLALYGLGVADDPTARTAFGIGLAGTCATIAVAFVRKSSDSRR
jgi:hypothetical protein